MRTSVTTRVWLRVVAAETAGSTLALGLVLAAAGCASAPPAPPVVVPPGPSYEQALSSIVQLEDERRLREPQPPEPAPAPVVEAPVRGRRVAPPAPPPPPLKPDLTRFLTAADPRIRRRAALAIGRVGQRDGVQPLAALLADADPEVRQMAAFAIGLIGDASGRDALVPVLDDPSPLVKGSAAEALGLIGDASVSSAVARMASGLVDAGAVAQPPSDDEDARRDTPASALRLAIFALVRLKAYDQLASVVLDAAGQPRVRWWPVAFALQRLEDPRGKAALLTLLREPHPYTRAFAVKGLGAMKDTALVPTLVPLVTGSDRMVAIEAVRALARLGDPAAVPALLALIQNPKADPYLRLEAVAAAGAMPSAAPAGPGLVGLDDALLDTLADPAPTVRAAVLRTIAQRDPATFVTILSGLDADPEWSVRAALATVLGTLSPETGLPRLRAALADPDERVIPAVLASLTRLHAPDATAIMLTRLKADDPVVRAAAARGLADLKSVEHGAALAQAYRDGARDTTYVARTAALGALAELRAPDAVPVLTEALSDKDWAVRLRAATLLKTLDPSIDTDTSIRPAPTSRPPGFYDASRLIAPPVSTQFYLDTDRGTVQFELAVLDAPLTVDNFVTLARRGFFDGLSVHRVVPDFVIQAGDPRGDSEGGPGYTIRDELNQRPYVRGTLGMALDWADTGGSQFFVTQSPQPHLDARYTVFGRVLSGMDVIDRIQPGDVIRRVRVWDGTP